MKFNQEKFNRLLSGDYGIEIPCLPNSKKRMLEVFDEKYHPMIINYFGMYGYLYFKGEELIYEPYHALDDWRIDKKFKTRPILTINEYFDIFQRNQNID